jgi:hypothetical protein
MMVDKKICCYCHKEIIYGDKEVLLKTTKGDMLLENKEFHFECWLNDYTESVDKKVESYANKLMAFAKPAVGKAMEARGMFS